MCGRFAFVDNLANLYEYFRELNESLGFDSGEWPEYSGKYNIGPGQEFPVCFHQNGVNFNLMHWGISSSELFPGKSDFLPDNKLIFNIRRESLTEKRSFDKLFRHHRCVIFANGYFEWQQTPSGKQPHYIFLENGKVMPFAGLWLPSTGPDSLHPFGQFGILTRPAPQKIQYIHHRAPVVLERNHVYNWLNSDKVDTGKAIDFLDKSNENFDYYPVSTKVNSINFDGEECIKKIDILEQPELF